MTGRHSRSAGLVAALAALTLLAGCGSGSAATSPQTAGATSDGTTSTGTPSVGTASGAVAEAQRAVQDALDGKLFGTPPADGPPPAAGKKVYVLSAFQQVSGLAYLSAEAQEAAKALGWTSTVCDGQNNANGGWAACVRQAVAAGADGIVLNSIDCAPVRAALLEARAAHVTVATTSAFDCSDPAQGGSESLVDAPVVYATGVRDQADYNRAMGVLRAQWVIAQTRGTAKILHVEFSGVAFGGYLSQGFMEAIGTCSGCQVVKTLSITPTDIGRIRQLFETALVQSPQVDTVVVDADFMFPAGIQQALSSSGRKDLTVAGGDCSLEGLGYIRAGGGEQMCIGIPLGYLSWAAVDGLNRVFNGQEPVSSGVGFQLVDAKKNLPPQGEQFQGPVDFRAAYKKAWGVG